MGIQTVSTANLMCSFGTAPSTFTVLPVGKVMGCNKPAATIMDNKPFVNIMPFAMCIAPSNPAVIAASGAPVPCVPNTVAPWVPGCATVMIGGKPALNNNSKLNCMWAGVISITVPGQFTVMIP